MKEYTGYSLKNNKEVYVFWDEKLINGTIHIVYNREEKFVKFHSVPSFLPYYIRTNVLI